MKKEFAPNVCLECVKSQESCCWTFSTVPMTISDIKRIEKMWYKKEDFVKFIDYEDDDFTDYDQTWWKNMRSKYKWKKYKTCLKKWKSWYCIFLKEWKWCVLNNDRPAVCKLYPFWFVKNKLIIEPTEFKRCLWTKLAKNVEQCIESMCETKESLKKCFDEIRNDCIKNKKKHQELIEELNK